MEKNLRELEILKEIRLALKENLEAFLHKRDRLKSRLNVMLDHIDAAENEIEAIGIQLKALAKKDSLVSKLIKSILPLDLAHGSGTCY